MDSSVEVGYDGFRLLTKPTGLNPVSPDLCDQRQVTYVARCPFSYWLCDIK